MIRYKFLSMPFILVCGLIAIVLVGGPLAEAQISGPKMPQWAHPKKNKNFVVITRSRAFRKTGKTYSKWSVEFWKWLYSMPQDRHPLFDTADCSEGQSGKVWFLGGTLTTVEEDNIVIGEADRYCSVPRGKVLFFPILNVACDNTPPDENATKEELEACSEFFAGGIQKLKVTIDGRKLKQPGYPTQSPLFTYGPLPENNVNGLEAGTSYQAVDNGYYLMLKPLSEGDHKIHFKGEFLFTEEVDGFDYNFALDITYNLNVKDVEDDRNR